MKLPEALGVVLSGRVAQGVGLGAGGGLMLLGTGGLVGDWALIGTPLLLLGLRVGPGAWGPPPSAVSSLGNRDVQYSVIDSRLLSAAVIEISPSIASYIGRTTKL